MRVIVSWSLGLFSAASPLLCPSVRGRVDPRCTMLNWPLLCSPRGGRRRVSTRSLERSRRDRLAVILLATADVSWKEDGLPLGKFVGTRGEPGKAFGSDLGYPSSSPGVAREPFGYVAVWFLFTFE